MIELNWDKLNPKKLKQKKSNWEEIESSIQAAIEASYKQISLSDTPEFPLAFNVDMPPGFRFKNGHLGMKFSGFSLKGHHKIKLNRDETGVSDERLTLRLTFPSIEMLGHYSISSKQVPKIMMDTGGDMMDFNDEDNDYLPAGAEDAGDEPLTPEQKSAMLDQAREQKKHLRETKNGQNMLETFNQHNEIYNTVFVTSSAARTAWSANGVTKKVALDTHTSLANNNTVINKKDKEYAPNVTYNSNAFNQQLQIIVNTVAADPDFNPFDPNSKLNPDSQYVKASLAAMTFGFSANDTGNDKSKVTELTSDDVFHNVKTGKPPKDATIDELKNIVDQGMGAGGADEKAKHKKWRILDEEDRAKVRRYLYEAMKERLLKSNNKPVPLWSGACRSLFEGTSATVEIGFSHNRKQLKVLNSQITLPAFEIDLDDRQWAGKAGDIVRERISQIFFIRRLLHDKIETGLCKMLEATLPDSIKRVL